MDINELNNMLKKLGLIALTLLFVDLGFAQNEDSAVYRQFKVREVITKLRMPMMQSKDTCIYRIQKINEKGWLTEVSEDNLCMGWNSKRVTNYTYDSLGRIVGVSITNNDKMETKLELKHDKYHRVVEEIYTWFEPFQNSSLSKTIYFGAGQNADSAVNITYVDKDTFVRRSKNYYVGEKLVKSEERSDTSEKLTSMTVLKYNNQDQLIRFEFSNFEAFDQDQVTTYTYHEDGKVLRSEDVLYNTAAEFFYYKTGVPGVTFYYNKFGDLEREEFYQYKHYR